MKLDRLFPNIEVRSNLFVQLAANYVTHDFALARREYVVPLPEVG